MNKKIIIFGYGELGEELARHLKSKRYDFTIATNDKNSFKRAKQDGLRVEFLNDITDDEELIKLGIGIDVNYIFCVTEDDTINIFLTISARAIDSNLKIISEAESADSKAKFELAGANKVIDPYEITATKIYDIIKKPQIIDILDHTIFGDKNLNLAEIRVTQSSKLNKIYLSELNLRESYNLIAIGIIDKKLGKNFRFVTGEYRHQLSINDILIVVGKLEDIDQFKVDVKVNL